MNIPIKEIAEGFVETVELFKQGENIFDMGNSALFPTLQHQAQWKFAKTPNGIQLSDGTHVYHFNAPGGFGDEDFPLTRGEDIPITDFGKNSLQRGTAQVHRSDPGSIYFTLQEGYKNPTYTFKHVGEKNWKAIPKKKPLRKLIDNLAPQQEQPAQPMLPPHVAESLKQGMINEMIKSSDLNKWLGEFVTNTPDTIKDNIAMLPGISPIGAAVAGATAGLTYDQIKRQFYNTEEENQEEGWQDTAKRIALPAAGLGLLGQLEHNIGSGAGNYYNRKAIGAPTNLF